MIRWILFLVLLSTSAIQAADVVISAPPTPVEVREPVDLPVSGLATAELSKVRFGVVPDTARVTTRIDWGGATYLQFWAKAPGKYTVTLSLNEWRRGLDDSFFTAKQAGVPPELLAKHEALIKEYAASFPFKSGSCVVVVAGVPFPPPVDPNQPPPIDPPLPNRIDRVTYIYEKDSNTVPRPVSLGLQKLNVESGYSVVATEFEEDTVDGDNQVPDQYAIALKAAREAGLPALVVQAGNVVVKVIKDPKTEQSVTEVVK